MKSRYSFGGDEHLFVECDESMSLEAFFKSLSMTRAIREAGIAGITEICPANASFQIRFDPDRIKPDDILTEVRDIETAAAKSEPVIGTRIIEIPVFYQDPWTHETLMRFRERHQDPQATDLEYAARINDLASVENFVAAHSGSPWFVSMVGFVAGLPFMYQMVERARQLQVPKYLRPRTDTPKLTVGFRRDLPLVLEEGAPGLLLDAVPIEARQHAKLCRCVRAAAQGLGHAAPFLDRSRLPEDEFVAFGQGAALMAAERADDVGGTAAECQGNVEAAGDGDVDARAGFEKTEAEGLARLDAESGPGRLLDPADLDRHLAPGDGDGRIAGEFEFGAEEHGLQAGLCLVIADQEIGGTQGQPVHRPADGNAEMEITRPAEVLDGGG
jgi:allophanate hydrolase subunit 1